MILIFPEISITYLSSRSQKDLAKRLTNQNSHFWVVDLISWNAWKVRGIRLYWYYHKSTISNPDPLTWLLTLSNINRGFLTPKKLRNLQDKLLSIKDTSTGKSLSEALLFGEHGENMLCTEVVLSVKNNFCTQHVLPMFWAWNNHVLSL